MTAFKFNFDSEDLST